MVFSSTRVFVLGEQQHELLAPIECLRFDLAAVFTRTLRPDRVFEFEPRCLVNFPQLVKVFPQLDLAFADAFWISKTAFQIVNGSEPDRLFLARPLRERLFLVAGVRRIRMAVPLRDPESEGLRLDRRQDPLPNQLGQEQIDAKRVAVES